MGSPWIRFFNYTLLVSVLELKEWLYERVQDDNDIVVDDLQATLSPWQ